MAQKHVQRSTGERRKEKTETLRIRGSLPLQGGDEWELILDRQEEPWMAFMLRTSDFIKKTVRYLHFCFLISTSTSPKKTPHKTKQKTKAKKKFIISEKPMVVAIETLMIN